MELKDILKDKKAIIMDFDGTITNTEPLNFKTWQYMFKPYGIDFTENDFKDILGHPIEKIVEILESKYENFDKNEFANSLDEYIKTFKQFQDESNLQMFDYVKDILEQYKDIPKYILSNQTKPLILNMFEKWGIEDEFTRILSCMDERLKKQNVYENAKTYFGFDAKDCVLCEDSQIYLDAGKLCGMTTIGVQHSFNPKVNADFVITIE